MTPAEFKRKWSRYQGKETSAYQGHFDDLCRLLGQPTPAEADPSGSDFFCYQKRVIKDAELFDLGIPDPTEPNERGFADVWKKGCFGWEYKGKKKARDVVVHIDDGCFGWEYKGKKKNLDDAYKQLLRYREALLNPPLLVVCDFDRYIVRTNFNGTVQETHEFTNDQIDHPENFRLLRALFENPDFLKPQRTTAQVTEKLAETIAEVAKSLQKREAEELADARTRAEMNFAQRKNLRMARFLNRIVFCFFAEDTGLLPKNLFSEVLKSGLDDPRHLAETLENLFAVMAKGGTFGKDRIRHFNGHLFEESTVFELTEDELKKLADAGEADWQFIQPSIMGTLFERALEPEQRSQLGAHYTSEADIKTLVEPVLMAPLRREWEELKSAGADVRRRDALPPTHRRSPQPPNVGSYRAKLEAFQKKLAAVSVLDPACGSGNFLYVSLQLLLGLEKEAITYATQLGFKLTPQVSVQQLRAIEINPYAYELAQVSVQIGFLQWRRDNGFDNDRSPVLQNLDGFQNEDALLVPHFRSKAKTLKEAQAGEHAGDDALKFYTVREWPKCDVVVGNPPFLGGKLLRRELGDAYVDALFETYGQRVRPEADLCCYWFSKAQQLIAAHRCRRAGLLATQGIRGGANREVLNEIKKTGDIFFAASDRDWVLAGANVHVSMVGFDDGTETVRTLDGKSVEVINPNLTAVADVTTAKALEANLDLAFMGTTKGGPFDIPESMALELLLAPNPHGRPNSDVVVPWVNGMDLTQRPSGTWIIDFGVSLAESDAAKYAAVYEYARAHVKPQRDESRTTIREWWLHERRRGEMRVALAPLARFVCTTRVSKHRLFVWLQAPTLPDSATFAFARSGDVLFGLLHSRIHEVWARLQGTQVRERESGFRYTPTSCLENFAFPRPTPVQEAAIAAAAKELNDLRERWLNPPEWTETRVLEFPGTVSGPWSRYVDMKTVDARTGIGTVRYPRLEPRNAEFAAKLKDCTLTKLYNKRPVWLDLAHQKLDAAVATAYGWPSDLTDEQILERLLALNLERAAEETKAAKVKKPQALRGKAEDEMI